jgi:acetyl-CoA carboxylase carboxyl transferase subunit beta
MALVLDEDTFTEADASLESSDPLDFRIDGVRYRDSLRASAKKAGPADAFVSGSATIDGHAVEVGFFVFEFMGGSMGSVVGEKIARQFERAHESGCPALVFSASGGARMQEGVLSLMQMAKTSAARSRLREASIPYISVLLHPTTGGVAASFAMLGDIIMAEPNALIGFAGPRVIEQTIRQQLPEGFQRSEFLLEHGMLDMIVERKNLKPTLGRLLAWFDGGKNGAGAAPPAAPIAPEGAIVITTDVEDAVIEVDGQVVARFARRAVVPVVTGRHDVRVSAANRRPFHTRVEVGARVQLEVHAVLDEVETPKNPGGDPKRPPQRDVESPLDSDRPPE